MTRWKLWYINNKALDCEAEYLGTFGTLKDAFDQDYECLADNYQCGLDNRDGESDNACEHPSDYMRVSKHDPHNCNELYRLPDEDTGAIVLVLSSSENGREITFLVREGYWQVYDHYGRCLEEIDNLQAFQSEDEALRYIIKPDCYQDAVNMLRNPTS